jgi:hypothetical protein
MVSSLVDAEMVADASLCSDESRTHNCAPISNVCDSTSPGSIRVLVSVDRSAYSTFTVALHDERICTDTRVGAAPDDDEDNEGEDEDAVSSAPAAPLDSRREDPEDDSDRSSASSGSAEVSGACASGSGLGCACEASEVAGVEPEGCSDDHDSPRAQPAKANSSRVSTATMRASRYRRLLSRLVVTGGRGGGLAGAVAGRTSKGEGTDETGDDIMGLPRALGQARPRLRGMVKVSLRSGITRSGHQGQLRSGWTFAAVFALFIVLSRGIRTAGQQLE